jgi:hypothetical protein
MQAKKNKTLFVASVLLGSVLISSQAIADQIDMKCRYIKGANINFDLTIELENRVIFFAGNRDPFFSYVIKQISPKYITAVRNPSRSAAYLNKDENVGESGGSTIVIDRYTGQFYRTEIATYSDSGDNKVEIRSLYAICSTQRF